MYKNGTFYFSQKYSFPFFCETRGGLQVVSIEKFGEYFHMFVEMGAVPSFLWDCARAYNLARTGSTTDRLKRRGISDEAINNAYSRVAKRCGYIFVFGVDAHFPSATRDFKRFKLDDDGYIYERTSTGALYISSTNLDVCTVKKQAMTKEKTEPVLNFIKGDRESAQIYFRGVGLDKIEFKALSCEEGYNTTNIKSCMQNKGSYYKILDKTFKDKVRFYKALLNDKEVARFLWWDISLISNFSQIKKACPFIGSAKGLVDRIYCDDGLIVKHIKEWASDNNFISKQSQTYDTPDNFIYQGNSFDAWFEIKAKNFIGHKMPYLDTFREMNLRRFVLISSWNEFYNVSNDKGGRLVSLKCPKCGQFIGKSNFFYNHESGCVEHIECEEQKNETI
jgi:hypothetical protein